MQQFEVYDLHSANATMAPNAAWRLTWALATLKDQNERVLIPGFYDAVRPPIAAELAAIDSTPLDDDILLADWQITNFLGGKQRIADNLFAPTCTICGLISGYTGIGSKTVLPSEARAKIDFRMVPDQNPAEIVRLLRTHLDANGFSDIEILEFGHDRPARFSPDSAVSAAMARAIRRIYGKEPVVYPSMSGTGPVYPVCARMKDEA